MTVALHRTLLADAVARITLRPYQQKLRDDVESAWAMGARNVLAVLPTGGGKTALFSTIMADETHASCAVAHRQELVSQISLALARNRVRHRIIGPQSVVKMIVRLHMEEVGASYYDPSSKCAVAGIDTLVRRGDQLASWLPTVKLWVMDECFVAGTLIDGKPISDIRIGDVVTAFNETTGEFEPRTVMRLFKNPAPEHMIRVTTQFRHVLHCTNGHPFWTKRGWVNAQDLMVTDEVLVNDLHMHVLQHGFERDERVTTVSIPQEWNNLLSGVVRVQDEGRATSEDTGGDTIGFEVDHSYGVEAGENRSDVVHMVSAATRDIGLGAVTVSAGGSGVLQPDMLGQLQIESIIRNNESDKRETCVRSDENQQPNGSFGNSRKGSADPHCVGSSASAERWERATSDGSRNDAVLHADVGGVLASSNRKDWPVLDSERLPEALQNRLRESRVDDCNRSGRCQPFDTCSTGARRSENCVPGWVGLDSIEIFKSSDLERTGNGVHDGHVYNFEVEGLHTYVANGVTVHNCHHVLKDNKWGKGTSMFPNARGLGVTATPSRADGNGLGRHADGVMDVMVIGPSMRELIDMKFLTDYKLFAPKSDFDRSSLTKSISKTTGEISAHESSKAVSTSSLVAHAEKGQVVGDVVRTYQKLIPGLRTIVFAPDVATAYQLEAEYIAAGIPAKCIHGDMDDLERSHATGDFKRGKTLVLINVALLDEGYDCPAIQAVQDVAATESFGRFVQRAGRMLRLMDGKEFGIYVDHVGNIARHATVVHYPDQSRVEICHREWTLDRRERRSAGKSEISDTRTCNTCTGTFPRFLDACPYCGEPIPAPAQRSSVEWVDGDLYELDAATLATMRAAIARVDMAPEDYRNQLVAQGCPQLGVLGNVKRLVATQEIVAQLREAEAVWAGYERAAGLSDREIMRKFFSMFGVDLWTAQTWKAADMTALIERINGSIRR